MESEIIYTFGAVSTEKMMAFRVGKGCYVGWFFGDSRYVITGKDLVGKLLLV